ncbi:Diaminohydroxyphosphoribosylaminopyrimidine deaminase / 5-amino-6-(5-phosphoribosylamino)uracil reductase [Methylophaga frappieri]|uniref:Riboflavin biosynthesis protein RibD n=1 Tax=Methylophaga frappieri (strain ATCC BAA-2434 / DSM 25690 / JAM7) TaxID=754477 RepID=I1YKX4_METFJ|nr:bifunctional diaminohydroxyphosphoribosylaminopyrimidine deaminase/5-amino-6-(5-phosphoribosylamino)uracil reductase RibD [Methylophaga frappieri]AFJ03567.1 Diaminohydroxyphosphoribosylaminopyrimidine deaminase / 5-amino-6-(5-phosphoribosylamino)uracil reductase [Methylophaga frappieri]
MPSHQEFMARAIVLAKRGLFTTDPNPRVGCVLVKNNEILAEGWHEIAGQPHAERHALAKAGATAKGADCYVTLEPCSHVGRTPPCADALIEAGIRRVVIAMKDPNPKVAGKGIARLEKAGIDVICGVLSEQAAQLNPGFIQRMEQGRPFVRSKIAMSLDGRTAMASGESKWITSLDSRRDVQKLRARSSAVLTGIGTILKDDPLLTVRAEPDWYQSEYVRQPLRVVVDSQLRFPEQAKMRLDGNPLLIITAKTISEQPTTETVHIANANGQVDLRALMHFLAKREMNEVMVEAGAILNGALLQARLVDELIFYVAAKLMGDNARGAFSVPGMLQMAQNIDLDITDMRAIGSDWRITAKPIYNEAF